MAAVDRNNPKRAASSDSDYTTMDFFRDFPDDATCLDWLWRRLYSNDGSHAECPKCEQERKFHRVTSRPSYSCDSCGHHIHPTAGTIFHKSSTSLHLWFHAIFLMASTRCGISAKQLEREIGVTYKTAWRMFHRIRNMLMPPEDDDTLSGEVEMDETLIGGKPRGKKLYDRTARAEFREAKDKVFGMVERGGKVRAVVVPDRTAATLGHYARSYVMPDSMIYTDEWAPYLRVGQEYRGHRRIRHKAHIYVDGDISTNTIEGFFGLVKNGIRGVYHSVSSEHLQSYLDEYAWRYNHREDVTPLFVSLLHRVVPYPSVV